MAVITQSTFNPLKAHCNVRLQQGVPIVDADWNELDDIRKFQLRSYLRWFVGDGIPNDGAAFRIDAVSAAGTPDNFIIKFGETPPPAGTSNFDQAMRFAGRAIVDGMDVMITADVNYKDQSLFAAAGLGAPIVAPIPPSAEEIAVYLDVWERLVTAQEDSSLVLSGIGTESCSRVRREWCVRTRVGKLIPKSGDADFIKDHSYYLLAIITRSANAPIKAANIRDQRHVRLSLATVENRLAALEQMLTVPKFNPSPNQFNPKLGAANAPVTLLGKNFNIDGLEVKFGEVVATTSGITGSQLTAAVPAGLAPGPVKITVKTRGGSVTSDDSFTVVGQPMPAFDAAPNQFTPKLGAQGANVELRGSNFNIGTPAVRFGSTNAAIVGTPTATRIVATVPAMALGAIKITVQTGAGSVISDDNFTVTN